MSTIVLNEKDGGPTTKRSCDVCRRHKIKCDGSQSKDGVCSHCTHFGLQCTYLEPAKRRGPKKKESRIEQLQQQIVALEEKLRQLSVCAVCSQPLSLSSRVSQDLVRSGAGAALNRQPADSSSSSSDSDEDEIFVSQFGCLSLGPNFSFGAGFNFVLAAKAVTPDDTPPGKKVVKEAFKDLDCNQIPLWEQQLYERRPLYIFPESDLMHELVGLYFENVHPTLPILHRKYFESALSEGLHLTDDHFAAALLAVLSVACLYSDDPRIFLDGYSAHSSGWSFINQVTVLHKGCEANIWDVTYYLLLTVYTLATSKAQDSWIYLGIGIRFLQQRGDRRVKIGSEEESNTLNDMWGRAFWSFVVMDRMLSALFGRPTTNIGLDVELLAFPRRQEVQTYASIYNRLCCILDDAMHRVYGSNTRTRDDPSTRDLQRHIVSELDSDMNDCFNSIPVHLSWNSGASIDNRSPQSYDQAFMLYVIYHYVRIVIHRPYIEKSNILAAPSLSIAVNAASSIIQAADAWIKVRQRLLPTLVVCPVFIAGTTLILSMFGTKTSNIVPSLSKGKELIAQTMSILEYGESRRSPDGRLKRLLVRLRYVGCPWAYSDCPEPTSGGRATGENINSTSDADHFLSHSDSYELRPGVTIEELLSGMEPPSMLPPVPKPDELDLSYWTAAPINFSNVMEWDSFIEHNLPVDHLNNEPLLPWE
ncbi:Fungal-trans domain-containing protein [Mycena indigotica]|uniref:Fungal-trans domain-containing protein n=1 Tax=Mycena indigotica TaxID=2126181 RepID=A0A8H6SJV2_9AGAR|nr:Fungal-trans domain-containing protein [Mycena indigotica]KAF7299170.1 Fungal-trans domain-containing protein [Mycena indigotica]